MFEVLENLVFPNAKKNRPEITYTIAEGSVRHIFKTSFQTVIAFTAILASLSDPRTIDKCIRGETKTAHNLIWKRCEPNNVPLLIEPLSTNTYIKNRAKKISQYSLDNKYIKTYKSINDAAKVLHKPRQAISDCLYGKYQTAYGFKWRYVKTK